MQQREMTKCLKALANERRIRIIRELGASHEYTVGDLARRIKLSYKSTSKHLLKLAECDLITREQRSLEVYCRLNPVHPILRLLLPHLKS
jgi:DNA-binding transcriptional ArsR family regulator